MNVLIVILTFILIILCIFLSKNLFGNKSYLFSPPVVVLGYFLIRSYPGTIDSSFLLESYKPLFGVLIAVFSILCALLTIGLIPNKSKIVSSNYIISPKPLIIYSPILLGALAVIFTFIMFGRVPFFYLFQDLLGKGSDLSMHAARRMNTLEHRSGDTIYFGQGYLKFLYLSISPVFISILYVYRRVNNKNVLHVKIIMFIFCFFAALNGQIWPVVNTILVFAITIFSIPYIFSSNTAVVKSPLILIKKVLKLMLFIIIFIFIYRYAQQLSGREFDNFFLDTFRRIYSDDTAVLFELFPSHFDFRYGSTWLNDLAGFLPGSNQNFSYEVHYLVHGGGWGFTLAPGLFVSGYVNFGMLGIFILFYFTFILYCILYKLLISSLYLELRVMALYQSFALALALSADISSLVSPFLVLITVSSIIIVGNSFLNQSRLVVEIK